MWFSNRRAKWRKSNSNGGQLELAAAVAAVNGISTDLMPDHSALPQSTSTPNAIYSTSMHSNISNENKACQPRANSMLNTFMQFNNYPSNSVNISDGSHVSSMHHHHQQQQQHHQNQHYSNPTILKPTPIGTAYDQIGVLGNDTSFNTNYNNYVNDSEVKTNYSSYFNTYSAQVYEHYMQDQNNSLYANYQANQASIYGSNPSSFSTNSSNSYLSNSFVLGQQNYYSNSLSCFN